MDFLPDVDRQFGLLLLAGGLGTALLAKALVLRTRANSRQLPLPPGPKGWPIIGNLFDLPQFEAPWEEYAKMAGEYGDLVYLDALGQGILVLGSHRRAFDLLESRAVNYSDRPEIAMIDLLDLRWNFVLMQYGWKWKKYRRAFHHYHNQNAVSQFHPIMIEERDLFLRKLRDAPENFIHHLEVFLGVTIMRSTYGLDDPAKNTSLVETAEVLTEAIGEAVTPGRFFVNNFPILKHVPTWFPGAGFQNWFREKAQASHKTLNSGFAMARAELENGQRSANASMAADLIDHINDEQLSHSERADLEAVAKSVCALSYLGGSETSISSAIGLILVLANHPGVQQKAQVELDSVIGPHRLPLISDRPSLPYLHSVVKELGRWYTVVPLALAHLSKEDDEYDGYFIPKGTIIIPNSWAMLHDPSVFEKPMDFIPERYLKDGRLDPSVPDADIAAFGFGRRICPGRHFGNDVLFLLTASLLATFNIAQPKDEAGNRVPLVLKMRYKLTAKPEPFHCEITARTDRLSLIP